MQYQYGVNDAGYSNSVFSQSEQRDGANAGGEYRVNLPDGRVQIVTYTAGPEGYNSAVTYEGEAVYPDLPAAGYKAAPLVKIAPAPVVKVAPVVAPAPVVKVAAPIAPAYAPAPVVHVKETPEPYTYTYGVADDYSKANFNAAETSDANGVVSGSYSVALPDGRIQHVKYTADHVNGYVAEVTYEGTPVYPEAKPYAPAPAYHA